MDLIGGMVWGIGMALHETTLMVTDRHRRNAGGSSRV